MGSVRDPIRFHAIAVYSSTLFIVIASENRRWAASRTHFVSNLCKRGDPLGREIKVPTCVCAWGSDSDMITGMTDR